MRPSKAAATRCRSAAHGRRAHRPVLAEDLATARDAAERIEILYEEIPAVAATGKATREEAPQLHAEAPRNVAYDWAIGDEETVDARLAAAAHRVEIQLRNNRIAGCPLETRGAIARWDAARETLHVSVSAQNVWRINREIASRLGLPPERVRVTIGDVGGGFGTKAPTYPEYTAIAFAARHVGRSVRWISDRSEAFLSDSMGRDHETRAMAGFDEGFRLVALRVHSEVAMGAYLSPHGTFIPSELVAKVLPGGYDFEHLFFAARGVYTNTTPVDAYRGAGRPEGIYVIERIMDAAARQFGMDPLELRKRNFVPQERFPYRNAAGETMDSGDYGRVADRARLEADVDGFPARRAESANRGMLRGLGIAFYVEVILGAMDEHARLRLVEEERGNSSSEHKQTARGTRRPICKSWRTPPAWTRTGCGSSRATADASRSVVEPGGRDLSRRREPQFLRRESG